MSEKQLKFHEAMNRLEEIVNQLNAGDLELEKAMELFEEGLKLSGQCSSRLKEFENRMDQLMQAQEDESHD